MSKPGIIVILYQGKELSTEGATVLASALKQYRIVENIQDIQIVYKDAEGIANYIANEFKKTINTKEQSPIEKAVIYIGTVFHYILETAEITKDYSKFVIAFVAQTRNNPELKRAMRIIATKSDKISEELQKKYHFNEAVIHIIKKIYETF